MPLLDRWEEGKEGRDKGKKTLLILIIIYIALFSYCFIALYNNYVIVEPNS